MIKRLVVLLLAAGILLAFEDVSFSARTLGLGGEHAAVADDAFSALTNPALPARWMRPVTALSATLYRWNRYWAFSYVQPVRGLGSIGGNLFYWHIPGMADRGSGDADARFFWAVPFGKHFNLGAAFGTHSIWRSPEQPDRYAFEERFTKGAFFSIGSLVSLPKGLGLGLSVVETAFDLYSSTIVHTGIVWEPVLKGSGPFSSLLLAGDLALRFRENVLKLHLGTEAYLFRDHLGLRVGIRYGTDELSGFSPTLGVTLHTHRLQKTDFELCYGTALNYGAADTSMILHQFSLNVLFGDARKAEKDSILAEQAERARRLREEALARERDRLREELDQIKKERAALERERADIERLRREALEEVGRIPGLGIVDSDSLVRITVTEQAIRFDAGSAQIPFPEGYRVLARISEFLANYPGKVLRVEAHTDNVPLAEGFRERYKDNQALSAARAEMVRNYFVGVERISPNLITARGLGSKEPVASNETEEGRALNRRIVITVFK